jgi:hypothetical protein
MRVIKGHGWCRILKSYTGDVLALGDKSRVRSYWQA